PGRARRRRRRPPPGQLVRRAGATGRDRPCARRRTRTADRGRTHGQPRRRGRRGDHRPVARSRRLRHRVAGRQPRPGPAGELRRPRPDHAGGAPDRGRPMIRSHDRALVLVARPTPAGLDERSLRAFVAAVAERTTGPVRAAYLDHGEPSIHSALDEVAAAGVDDVLLVPLAVPAGRYLVTWMAKAVANWRATRSHRVEIRISDGLTTLPAVADAVAALSTAEGRPIAASPAGFRSPAWSVLEIPERHLLVRRGPRCTVYGAGATYRALAEATRGTSTQVTPTGCVGPCNL